MRLKRETQGAFCVLNANAKSQTRKSMKINVICTVRAPWPESVWLSPIRFVSLRANSSRDYWYFLWHQLQLPDQTHGAGENSRQFPRFRHQPGLLRFPPHYLPRRTALDLSSNFWSSNFWSNPTTFVGSPTAAQERKS